MIAAVGEGWCFMVDAISYVAVILSLVAMRFVRAPRKPPETHVVEELRDGFQYVTRFAPVRALLMIVTIVSIFGTPYIVLMPAIVTSVLHGGPHTLGILMTAASVGALLGTFYLASRHTVVGLGKVIIIATAGLSAALIAFAFTRSLAIAILVIPFVGAGMMLQAASANTILQTVVEEHMRGRVMAFYTIIAGAVVCIAGAIYFGFRRPALAALIRPIYVERGILEAVPETTPLG